MTDFDIKSSTIEKGLDLVKGFLERAIGPTVDELGLMWQDSMRYRRATNQLKIFEKAMKLAEGGNVQIKQMDLKALFPLLQGMSLEEDETLQDLWANLFVNYIDSSKNLTITVYPGILSELSTHEASILLFMLNSKLSLNTPWNEKWDMDITREELGNLGRLGLIEPNSTWTVYENNGKPIAEENFAKAYYLNEFGQSFLKACTR